LLQSIHHKIDSSSSRRIAFARQSGIAPRPNAEARCSFAGQKQFLAPRPSASSLGLLFALAELHARVNCKPSEFVTDFLCDRTTRFKINDIDIPSILKIEKRVLERSRVGQERNNTTREGL
jgi:hypothetical protein